MFTSEQLKRIESMLAAGDKSAAVAASMGLTENQLRYGLLKSGKRLETRRVLVDAMPSDQQPGSLVTAN